MRTLNGNETEELNHRILLLTNYLTVFYEHVDPEFKSRDFVLLKHGLNAEETKLLDKYLINIHLSKE